MAKKKRKRSGGGRPTQPSAESAQTLSAEEQAARREQQRREWAEQKRRKERAARSAAPFIWAGGGIATVAAVVIGVIFLVQGGSGSESDGGATSTPDPRIGNATPAASFTIEAGDSGQAVNPYFEPNLINANAGDVIEIVVKNVGSVAHNLRVSGLDKEYDTRDDWLVDPGTLQPGDEGRVLVKINEPGQYPFRCDFHPVQQIGTLNLN